MLPSATCETTCCPFGLSRQPAENPKATAYFPPELQLTVAPGAHHTIGDFGKRLPAAILFIYGSSK